MPGARGVRGIEGRDKVESKLKASVQGLVGKARGSHLRCDRKVL